MAKMMRRVPALSAVVTRKGVVSAIGNSSETFSSVASLVIS
jgi:hypothetical protein